MANKETKPALDNNQKTREVRRITWIGLIINVFLVALKFCVGYLGASKAIMADAVHSLSDTTTDLAILFGVKYWSAPADDNHPYGHSRIETIISMVIGGTVFLVGIGIAYNSIVTIREVHLTPPGKIAIAGALVSLIFKEILYHWTVGIGKRIKSPALIANSWHHRSDALSSIPALIAVTIASFKPELVFVDHLGALIVSVFIVKASWDITHPALSELSDQGAPEKDLDFIKSIVMNIKGVESVHAVRTRKHGHGLHIDLHILVDGEMTVEKGHVISESVKRELISFGPDVIDVVVHMEPFE